MLKVRSFLRRKTVSVIATSNLWLKLKTEFTRKCQFSSNFLKKREKKRERETEIQQDRKRERDTQRQRDRVMREREMDKQMHWEF